MKTCLLYLPALLLATTAAAQEKPENITASLSMVEETATEAYFVDAREQNAILRYIRPVTVAYKKAPWFLLVVDVPDEKQVVHFTHGQLEDISSLVAAKDGRTHYLQVTNFFEVYTGPESTILDHYFVNSVRFAIRKRHWYRNNALFIVSSRVVGGEHVVRFQLPFAHEGKVCRSLVAAAHNLEENYFEATPASFLRLFSPGAGPYLTSEGSD